MTSNSELSLLRMGTTAYSRHNQAGAEVEIIIRTPRAKWLGWKKKIQSLGPASKLFYSWTDVGPAGISKIVLLPGILQRFPRNL
jgi:hypothetical protein